MSERWRAPSGKVHVLRQVWYEGTKDERAADPGIPIMLCGQRKSLEPVPDDTEITCRTCLTANPRRDE